MSKTMYFSSTLLMTRDLLSLITGVLLKVIPRKEPEENRKDGLVNQILGEQFFAKDYSQAHGWVVRGNISDPAIKIDVDDAINLALQFAIERK